MRCQCCHRHAANAKTKANEESEIDASSVSSSSSSSMTEERGRGKQTRRGQRMLREIGSSLLLLNLLVLAAATLVAGTLAAGHHPSPPGRLRHDELHARSLGSRHRQQARTARAEPLAQQAEPRSIYLQHQQQQRRQAGESLHDSLLSLSRRSSQPVLGKLTMDGASAPSMPHDATFASLSIEPAFYTDFFGNSSSPNTWFLQLLANIEERASVRPNIRPGGLTMDMMQFEPDQAEAVQRNMDTASGTIYGITVGPDYFRSLYANRAVISTLNLENMTYDMARDLVLASLTYLPAGSPDKLLAFELGNEANNFWNYTGPHARLPGYVQTWRDWTARLDIEIDAFLSGNASSGLAEAGGIRQRRWWACSTTPAFYGQVNLRPVELVPAHIDRMQNIDAFSLHNYQFSTCDRARAKLATIPALLNLTAFYAYYATVVLPSVQASQAAGIPWLVGEFNSVSCSGKQGVSNTFAQALWHLHVTLFYAARNASATYLHQGATLAGQSGKQENSAASKDGKPVYSLYDFAYPQQTDKRGAQKAMPGYLSLLVLAEALGQPGAAAAAAAGNSTASGSGSGSGSGNGSGTGEQGPTDIASEDLAKVRIVQLQVPPGLNADYLAAFAIYDLPQQDTDGIGVDKDQTGAGSAATAATTRTGTATRTASTTRRSTATGTRRTTVGSATRSAAAAASAATDSSSSGLSERAARDASGGGGGPSRLVLINTKPHTSSKSDDGLVHLDLSFFLPSSAASSTLYAKRLTASRVDTTDSRQCTWAGQMYWPGLAQNVLDIETITPVDPSTTPASQSGGASAGAMVASLRASEAMLVWLQGAPYDLARNGTFTAQQVPITNAAGARFAGIACTLPQLLAGAIAAAAAISLL